MHNTLSPLARSNNPAHGVGQPATVVSSSAINYEKPDSTAFGLIAPTNPWRPNPDDTRTPIAPPDTVSMHRRGAGVAQAPAAVYGQTRIDAINVVIARIIERVKGQIGGFVAQRIVDPYRADARAFCIGGGSNFCSLFFIHSQTVTKAGG